MCKIAYMELRELSLSVRRRNSRNLFQKNKHFTKENNLSFLILSLTVDTLGDGGVVTVVMRVVQVVVVTVVAVVVVFVLLTVDHVVRVGLGGVDVGGAEGVAGVEEPRLLRRLLK